MPHLAGAAAFELYSVEPSAIPVLIAVPHAGRSYSPALLERMRHPAQAALRLEDRLVDALGRAVAVATGASLLVAAAPRALIDLNRACDDVDWEMVHPRGRSVPSDGAVRQQPSRRARSGLGLVPRRLPGLGELWRRRLDPGELEDRIAGVHATYHAALAAELARLRARWGVALLIDLHSMPPLEPREGEAGAAFVLGDRFGTTCSGALIASAFEWFGRAGEPAAHNRPYAGGYVLERHAAPQAGFHAFQLEVDRARYLDSRLAELGDGFAPMVDLLAGLVKRLGDDVAALGRTQTRQHWSEAAE
ncbi:N-formylglutamate amidohydrolase [Novosphingobium piscinae]|uniref:N-formylglutamate amidohydrolase n=1 Tax=Novosphingobium piscinae TaxID=1507448 RepID=UPI0031B64F3F